MGSVKSFCALRGCPLDGDLVMHACSSTCPFPLTESWKVESTTSDSRRLYQEGLKRCSSTLCLSEFEKVLTHSFLTSGQEHSRSLKSSRVRSLWVKCREVPGSCPLQEGEKTGY